MIEGRRARLLGMAAAGTVIVGMLSFGSVLRAADEPATPPAPVPPAEKVSDKVAEGSAVPEATPPAAPRKPLMELLDRAGWAKPLDDARINVFGYVESSFGYNVQGTHNNQARTFDVDNEEVVFNQANLTFERTVDVTKGVYDIGGRMEWTWGADSGFIHSNGLFDWYDSPRTPPQQWDLTQAYVDMAIPVGNGLRVRAGKFVTLLGYETINPTTNPLYSHSYLFGFAIPFTHTGVLGTYAINDKMTINAGITRGWEQSLEDNNDAPDFLGSVSYIVDEKLTLTLANTTGPEQPGNSSDYRTVFDLIAAYAYQPDLMLVLNGDVGFDSDAEAAGDDAMWFGLAGYATKTICKSASLTGRGEWFNDNEGARGLGTTVYEVTVGLSLIPFPDHSIGSNFKIRPEIRYDYADDAIFDGGSEHNQITFAVDAIFAF